MYVTIAKIGGEYEIVEEDSSDKDADISNSTS